MASRADLRPGSVSAFCIFLIFAAASGRIAAQKAGLFFGLDEPSAVKNSHCLVGSALLRRGRATLLAQLLAGRRQVIAVYPGNGTYGPSGTTIVVAVPQTA
jgi:hypothetical protein